MMTNKLCNREKEKEMSKIVFSPGSPKRRERGEREHMKLLE
jgi:hypothetical protein